MARPIIRGNLDIKNNSSANSTTASHENKKDNRNVINDWNDDDSDFVPVINNRLSVSSSQRSINSGDDSVSSNSEYVGSSNSECSSFSSASQQQPNIEYICVLSDDSDVNENKSNAQKTSHRASCSVVESNEENEEKDQIINNSSQSIRHRELMADKLLKTIAANISDFSDYHYETDQSEFCLKEKVRALWGHYDEHWYHGVVVAVAKTAVVLQDLQDIMKKKGELEEGLDYWINRT